MSREKLTLIEWPVWYWNVEPIESFADPGEPPTNRLARQLAGFVGSASGSTNSSDGPLPSGAVGQGALSEYVKSWSVSPSGPSSATRSPPLERLALAYPVGAKLMELP